MCVLKDPLTQLLNRRAIGQRLENVRNMLARDDQRLLLFVDLQGVFEINRQHGWQAGDALLRDVSRRLQEFTGKSGFVGRFGGCHFVLFNPEVSPGRAPEFGAEVAHAVEAVRPLWRGEALQISVWLGVVPVRPEYPSVEDLMVTGLVAVRHAASSGTGNVYVASEYVRL